MAKIESKGQLDGHLFAVKRGERNPASAWKLLTRCATPEKWILLGVTGGTWRFQDPRDGFLYRCEIDPDGNERWFHKAVHTEGEWISQSEAARLLGVSRQAIGNAIASKRLATVDCDGRRRLRRTDVLASKITTRPKGLAEVMTIEEGV